MICIIFEYCLGPQNLNSKFPFKKATKTHSHWYLSHYGHDHEKQARHFYFDSGLFLFLIFILCPHFYERKNEQTNEERTKSFQRIP